MAKSSEQKRGLPAIGKRLLAAVILLPIVIWVTLRGGWIFYLMAVIWVIRLVWEYDSMRQARGVETMTLRNALLAVLVLTACWAGGLAMGAGVFALIVLLFMSASAIRGRVDGATGRTGERVLGLFYLGLLPAHWLLLRELPLDVGLPYRAGGHWFLFAAGLTWLSDTFAYVVGSLLGRHSLGSTVSPKKSVEGVIGGLLGCMFCAWALARYWAPFLALWQVLAAGALISLTGQLGDLFESLLKRDAAIKDTGRVIPGHGGFLDRVDSMLFSLPFFYYFLLWAIF